VIKLASKNWVLDNIETILFDKDGTFIDLHFFWGQMTELRVNTIINKFSLPENLFDTLCENLGYNTNTKKMIPNGITALYSRSKIIDIFNIDLKKHGLNLTNQELEQIFDDVSNEFYKNMQKYTKPINEAISFIKDLHKFKIKTGIVTSDSKESTMLTLKQFNWESLFDVVIGRESSPEPKESGIPTKLALELLQANPTSTIMIGDAPTDFISAINADIERTILVATGQVPLSQLKNHSPYTVKSLNELEIIKK